MPKAASSSAERMSVLEIVPYVYFLPNVDTTQTASSGCVRAEVSCFFLQRWERSTSAMTMYEVFGDILGETHECYSSGQWFWASLKNGEHVTTQPLLPNIRYFLIANPKGEAIIDGAQGECRSSKSYLSVCVCLSVNNAVRCTLLVLNTIQPVPP